MQTAQRKAAASPPASVHRSRLALLGLGIVALLAAIWGGLTRLPLNLPLPADNANWLTFHGPLMVCGFLGTVLSLERAVGLPDRWPYLAPLLTAAGGLTLVLGSLGPAGPLLLTAGSALFFLVTLRVIQLRRELFTVTMSLGAAAWLVGNVLWLCDWSFARVTPWWMAFLGLTIVGERIDLSRFQRQEPAARPLILAALGLFLGGVAWSAFVQIHGERLLGAGLIALAAWLARFDIVRRTVRETGLPRFMAVCLLSGYVWLAVSGAFFLFASPLQPGSSYDAALHAFFLGFVFAMILGHAPVIFPSVLGRPLVFNTFFYAPLVLLHLSLLLRVAGSLALEPEWRQWGAVLNAATLAVFLANTAGAMLFHRPGKTSRRAAR
jgi:hypothetical protein